MDMFNNLRKLMVIDSFGCTNILLQCNVMHISSL